MLTVLANRTYRHLLAAQVIALVGTGLLTVALGLLAWDIAGADAGLVLGTALAIKMIAYVGIAPVAQALAGRVPRRRLLVALDLLRAAIALALPFVTEVWQVYLLIFLLQAASAGFTPTFQASIPDVLPDEADYTRALSLSRLAYDLESLASPMLAALLLAVVPYDVLFLGTVAGFLGSAALVISVVLPDPQPTVPRGIYERTIRGARIYLATPRLRGLLALNLSAAAAGAMIIVNSVVLVRDTLGRGEGDVALALAAFGGGSMLAALMLPRLLAHVPDRPVMVAGAAAMMLALAGLSVQAAAAGLDWAALVAAWLIAGIGYSAALTPAGRLLRRSAHPEDRPAVFAAQFALSHACWLVTYPLAGWLMTSFGAALALLVLAAVAALGIMISLRVWPARDPVEREHRHDDLPPDHSHLTGSRTHSHAYVIDDLHRSWTTPRK